MDSVSITVSILFAWTTQNYRLQTHNNAGFQQEDRRNNPNATEL
jgi:hypothetical protein